MKKHSRSGFTLMELIIVIALFSIIMYSIVALMDPVSKYFVRSSNFESTTACMDNIKRGIEGNLKYADRVRVYKGYAPYEYEIDATSMKVALDSNGVPKCTYSPTADLKSNVQKFYDYFFKDRKYLCSHGSIYVLCFDNTVIVDDTDLQSSTTGLLHDYTEKQYNTGKMVLYEFKFDNYNNSVKLDLENPVIQPWYINQNLYGNYDYSFKLGAFDEPEEPETTTTVSGGPTPPAPPAPPAPADESPAVFNPQDCTIGIQIREVMKSSSTASGLVRSDYSENASSSFAMKNVLDATKHYTKPLADYVLIENPNPPAYTAGDTESYLNYLSEKYITLKNGAGLPIKKYRYAALSEKDPATITDADRAKFDGFYFIFTVPEKVFDDTDKDEDYTKFVHSGHTSVS